ncbi:MAG: hypothetical protein ABJO86_17370 [Lentilitoribacter sp.]
MNGDKNNLEIYQIAYDSNSENTFSDEVTIFDISSKNIPRYREINALKLFTASKPWLRHKYTGLFSPRFYEKTLINYNQINDFIAAEQDADIYLFHPYPLEFSIANGFLDLAELEHPGMINALEDVWKNIFNADLPYVSCSKDTSLICHCNYFIASEKFWTSYSEFLESYWGMLTMGNNTLGDNTNYTLTKTKNNSLPLGVFAFERALSLFLKHNEEEFIIKNYSDWDTEHVFPELFEREGEFVEAIKNTLYLYSKDKQVKIRENAIKYYYEVRKQFYGH